MTLSFHEKMKQIFNGGGGVTQEELPIFFMESMGSMVCTVEVHFEKLTKS